MHRLKQVKNFLYSIHQTKQMPPLRQRRSASLNEGNNLADIISAMLVEKTIRQMMQPFIEIATHLPGLSLLETQLIGIKV